MKSVRLINLIVVSALLAAGCTTVKRYQAVASGGTDNTIARIDLFGFRLSESGASEPGKNLWDLTADAQSQLIKILNNRYPGNDNFREAMNFRYPAGKDAGDNDNYVRKDLRLVFSVSRSHDFFKYNGGLQPTLADRIEYLKIGLSIAEETPFHFTRWNLFSTEYGTIDIADISFSRTIDLGLTAGVKAGKGDNTELSSDGTISFGREEDQKVKYRFMKLNGRMSNNRIEMEEEGTREIDLAGNIIADVSVEFDGFRETVAVISGLSDSTGMPSVPEKISVRFADVSVPLMEDIKDTIFAELRMDYIYRNVVSGEKTFPEWDDRIRYIAGSVTKKVPVLTARDYVPGFCCLGALSNGAARENVWLESTSGERCALTFRTYAEAFAFYDWLDWYFRGNENKIKAIRLGKYTVKFRNAELTGPLFYGDPAIGVLPFFYR